MSRCSCGRACRSPSNICRVCRTRSPSWKADANQRRKLRSVRAGMPRPKRQPSAIAPAAAPTPREPSLSYAARVALAGSRSLDPHAYHPACLCGSCTGLRWVTA